MWVLVLTVQDCIKVLTVSCECLYWLFRIVLRWWEFDVSVFIECSGLYSDGESFMWVIDCSGCMWVLVLTVQDCIKVVRVSCECLYWLFRIVLRWWEFHVSVLLTVQYCIKVVRISCECLYWLFRIVLRCWQFHVSACIDYSGWY